jgi:hypothetical protein
MSNGVFNFEFLILIPPLGGTNRISQMRDNLTLEIRSVESWTNVNKKKHIGNHFCEYIFEKYMALAIIATSKYVFLPMPAVKQILRSRR